MPSYASQRGKRAPVPTYTRRLAIQPHSFRKIFLLTRIELISSRYIILILL